MSILSLQTAFPTFKNDGFMMEILKFCEKSKFCFGRMVWERFGALSGSFWELLGVFCELSGAHNAPFYVRGAPS